MNSPQRVHRAGGLARTVLVDEQERQLALAVGIGDARQALLHELLGRGAALGQLRGQLRNRPAHTGSK
jgi:hypothetical protein